MQTLCTDFDTQLETGTGNTPRLQRTSGTGRLSVRRREGRSVVGDLYQEGAAKIRMPKVHSGPILEAVLMNTAGGLTGGDVFDWQITVDEAACAVATTPACERIYRTTGGAARIETRLTVGPHAALAYLPQETIVYDRAALSRRIEADLAPNASLLLLESLIFGRAAMGEIVHTADILDSWRIRSDGRLLHAEQLQFQGDIPALFAKASVTGGAPAMATCLFVHDRAADIVDGVRDRIGAHGGASAWRVLDRDKLLIRVVAHDGLTLRSALIPALLQCNKNLLGSDQYTLPKVWSL